MTREQAREEIEREIGMPLDRIQYTDLYTLLENERLARHEAEARMKKLEGKLRYQRRKAAATQTELCDIYAHGG